MMVWIRVLPQAAGRSIQLAPEVCHRSVDGDTLDLRPGYSREITDEEWAFVQAIAPDLLDGIQVLSPGTFDAREVADQPD